MRFEFHIVLDFSDFKMWIKKKIIKKFGEPQTQNGEIYGYLYKGTLYAYKD